MKNIALIALLAISTLFLNQAHGQELGSLTTRFRADHQNVKWLSDSSIGHYKLSSMLTRVSGDINGVGTFVPFTGPINETRSEIIGDQIKGRMSVQIKKQGQKFQLCFFIKIDDENKGFPLRSTVSYKLPLKIIRGGTWQDYLDGKTIQMETSVRDFDSAELGYNSKMKSFLKNLLESAFAKGYGGMPITSSVEMVKLAQNMSLTANRKQIVINNMVTDYKISLSLGY